MDLIVFLKSHFPICKYSALQNQNLVISWRLSKFQSWPPDCVTCIATLPWIVLLALSVSIELVSSSARVTSVKSQHGIVLNVFRSCYLDWWFCKFGYISVSTINLLGPGYTINFFQERKSVMELFDFEMSLCKTCLLIVQRLSGRLSLMARKTGQWLFPHSQMLIDSTFFVQTTCSQNIPSQLYLYDYCNCICIIIAIIFVWLSYLVFN